jgi:uncharacterized protein YqeY
MPPDSMTEKDELGVLQKELKNKQEAKEMFAKANRTDLVAEQEYEIEILMAYLPKVLGEDELIKIVDEVMKTETVFGNIMREVGKLVAGKADGSQIATIVKSKLA